MGNTFSTMQIKNNKHLKPDEFVKALQACFKKKGLVPATEDDASVTYRLAFSDTSDWVVFNSLDYETDVQKLRTDGEDIAKTLKTHSLAISAYDSDMLELHLFGATDEQKDTILAGRIPWGDSPDDPPIPIGKQELWKPLLAEGATWENLTETLRNDSTYIEDMIPEIAPLLGMDATYITRYDGIYSENPNVVEIHFTTAKASTGKKPVSLKTAFKQVYGEALEPLGFKLIKSSHPYFVRLIGDEILHIITYNTERFHTKGYKVFYILGGVNTVYRQRLTLDKNAQYNEGLTWLNDIPWFYRKLFPLSDNVDKINVYNNSRYCYKDETTISEVERSLKTAEDIMLPVLSGVTDLKACIKYFFNFGPSVKLFYGDETFGVNDFNCDGLFSVKPDYRETYKKEGELSITRELMEIAHRMKTGYGNMTEERYANYCKDIKEKEPQRMAKYNEMFNNDEWLAKAYVELERRKNTNTETLKLYGFTI